MSFNLKDAQVRKTVALPSSAGTANTAAIYLGHGDKGDHVAEMEIGVIAPALSVAELPDAATMTYTIQSDDAEAFGSPSTVYKDVITQTGAGGAGAAAAEAKVRLPVDVEPYIRCQIALSVTAADASNSTATLEGRF